MYAERVLSGMRPTGSLHLGHYHGVLKNWITLQHEYPCLFFVADWHALTTQYDDPHGIVGSSHDMLVDWLAAGVDPARAILFIQSQVPEHAELHLLLSMMTPLSWLERVPTYKDQQEKLENKDLSTYGFLGYPLLQSADILIYRADKVPVGEDQVPHIEFSREIARRFNHLYGREPGFEDKAREAVSKLGAKRARRYDELRKRFQQEGEQVAVERARALLDEVAAEDLAAVGVPPRIAAVRSLSRPRQANLLRRWLATAHGTTPSAAQLGELLDQLAACTTRGHRLALRVGAGTVSRAGERLHWMPLGPAVGAGDGT